MIFLHLEGNHNSSGDIAAVLTELKRGSRTWWSTTTRDLITFSETYNQQGTEWAYIEALLELKQRIQRARTDTDSEAALSGKIVEDALYYGLDAMRQRRITVREILV